jgi:ABC-type multidrug transport system ATPase subunit
MRQTGPRLVAPFRELVRAYCALGGQRAEAVLPYAARLDLDLERVANKRVRDLSGGMKQKLLAALALSAGAPILVCDEPTASLDARARGAFFELVAERAPDTTLLLCSHRVDEVRQLVGRVVELKDGHVASDRALAQTPHAPSGSCTELDHLQTDDGDWASRAAQPARAARRAG